MNVLLTGASGGIGYAVTNYLANNGVTVYAVDVTPTPTYISNVKFYKCDITSEEELSALLNNFSSQNIVFDAIINVAGIFEINSFIEIDNPTLKKLFEVNFYGTVLVNKTLFPLLKENGRIIITTSEVAPLAPMPFNGIYNVTKTALDSYSQALRQELNLINKKVITIRPGAFNTKLAKGSLDKTEKLVENTVLYKSQSNNFYRLVKKFMGKPLSPEKIAPLYYKALTKKRPKLIYKKHQNFLLKLLDVLPIRLQCFIIKKLVNKK